MDKPSPDKPNNMAQGNQVVSNSNINNIPDAFGSLSAIPPLGQHLAQNEEEYGPWTLVSKKRYQKNKSDSSNYKKGHGQNVLNAKINDL